MMVQRVSPKCVRVSLAYRGRLTINGPIKDELVFKDYKGSWITMFQAPFGEYTFKGKEYKEVIEI